MACLCLASVVLCSFCIEALLVLCLCDVNSFVVSVKRGSLCQFALITETLRYFENSVTPACNADL